MSEFMTLRAEDLANLRVARVRVLEVELYKAMMQIEEAVSPDELSAVRKDAEDLTRRINVHREALGAEPHDEFDESLSGGPPEQ